MKLKVSSLSYFSKCPHFPTPLHVGQLNFPEWNRFESSFKQIFERGWYTNHGPLVCELEERLADFLKVRNVMCMTNATIGLCLAARALNLKNKVIVPAFTFAATVQSLTWAGIEPVFCDVDMNSHLITGPHVEAALEEGVSAVLGVHMWGQACNTEELARIASKNKLKIYYDSAHAFGCTHHGIPIGNFGELEVFSFHATKILNAAEGGCVCTNNDDLAAYIRNSRSSYGKGLSVPVELTGNGRMSEAQAAMALLSLEDFQKNKTANQQRAILYTDLLSPIPGIYPILRDKNEKNNYQYVVFEINDIEFGLSRNELIRLLEAENILCRQYFYPGMQRCPPYISKYQKTLNNTDELCKRVLQFPSGSGITHDNIRDICRIVEYIHENSKQIRSKMRKI